MFFSLQVLDLCLNAPLTTFPSTMIFSKSSSTRKVSFIDASLMISTNWLRINFRRSRFFSCS